MFKAIRNYLIIGTLALLPAVATLYVLKLLFQFIDPTLGITVARILDWVGLVEFPLQLGRLRFDTHIPGVGLLLTLGLLILVGMLAKSFFGRQMILFTERIFSRIPIARGIYSTVKQITNAFGHDATSFKRVVMVEYPRKGLYTLGFYTGESNDEIHRQAGEKVLNIFLPTTPNPTSGWLVLIPEKDVIFLDITVEDGLKYIISGGVVVPPANGRGEPTGVPSLQPGDSSDVRIRIKGQGEVRP
jgi:uncharacterized membrane protein